MSFGIKDILKFGRQIATVVAPYIGSTLTPAQLNALGLPLAWNASTNTPTLTSGSAPAADNCYRVTVAGSTALDGLSTWAVDDLAYFDGSAWQRIPANFVGVVTSALLKGNGSGGAVAATRGVDYASPMSIQCGVPIAIANSGTVGSNGALTLGTAFALTYSDGIWLYFPANALTGANAAGWYWTVMSTTTAGTVYNTTYTPGTNSGAGSWAIPASPTGFSGTTGGSYTAPLTAQTFMRVSVPAGALGLNGYMRQRATTRAFSSAGSKNLQTLYGGSSCGLAIAHSSSNTTGANTATTNIRGRADRQLAPTNDSQIGGGTINHPNVDSTVAQNMDLQIQLSVATDWIVVEACEMTYSAGPN